MDYLSGDYKWAIGNIWGPIKRIFGPKYDFLGPKKHPLLNGHHVLATTGKSCAKKKVPFSQININLLANSGVFLDLFSVIPARTRSVVNVSHFFGGPDGTTRFC